MNLDYSRVTHEQLLDQFKNRIISDPRFKDMSAAAIYQMYMEMMAGTFDMLHFYLGRTAEEMFLDSAKLDSSVIKLAKNLGYNPKRAIPATANIAVKLQGPLPKAAKAGDVIWFNNEQLQLKFNNRPYRLDNCYSYTLTEDDIANGVNSPTWTKTIQYSIPHDAVNGWIPLTNNVSHLDKIKIVQCEIKTAEIYAVSNAEHLTESYQFYDIDDIKFSNYYGLRDPYAYRDNTYNPLNGWCKVGIGLNKIDAFSEEKICDIEIENIYCNSKVKAANDDLSLTKKLNVCRIESNQDKTVRISFGDGSIVNNGFNQEDEILYVQYVVTDGYAANTPDVIDSLLTNSSRIMAHGDGRLYDVTDNIAFVLTTNISNGDDFESLQRLKNSAAVYFASRGQLINKKDFNDYFSSMSRPIHAKNAIAWTTHELKATTDETYSSIAQYVNNAKDAVFYTVIGDLYESLGNNQYKVKEVYSSEDDSIDGTTTLYNGTEDFLDHIGDLAYCVRSAENTQSTANTQATATNEPFYLNTSTIYKDIEEKLQFGVVPISIPPIVQYFDLVGTVELDRTANVATAKQNIESKIYKWLVDRQKFNNKIYKSDIIKLIYENAATKSVNVDITPSGLTSDNKRVFGFKVADDTTLATISDNSNVPYITSTNGYRNNVIVLPRVTTYYKADDASSTRTTSIAISEALLRSSSQIKFGTNSSTESEPAWTAVSIKSVTEMSDGRLQVTFNDTNYVSLNTAGTIVWFSVDNEATPYYANANDLQSTEKQAMLNALNYKVADVVNGTTETPVALPYKVQYNYSEGSSPYPTEREIDYVRWGNKFKGDKAITEKTFNFKMMQTNLAPYDYKTMYPVVKRMIEDSILDDNNNIVNYTLPNEISVVRIQIQYTYGR